MSFRTDKSEAIYRRIQDRNGMLSVSPASGMQFIEASPYITVIANICPASVINEVEKDKASMNEVTGQSYIMLNHAAHVLHPGFRV